MKQQKIIEVRLTAEADPDRPVLKAVRLDPFTVKILPGEHNVWSGAELDRRDYEVIHERN